MFSLYDKQNCSHYWCNYRDRRPVLATEPGQLPLHGNCNLRVAAGVVMSDKIRSYTELRELIRVSLRIQHPEWVSSDGNSPMCDFYDARFAELLSLVPLQEDEAELPASDRAEES